jgi:hypothetical protein
MLLAVVVAPTGEALILDDAKIIASVKIVAAVCR